MMNLERFKFNDYPGQEVDSGLNLLKERTNIVMYEGGGGRTTQSTLQYAQEHNCKVVSIDLCHKPKTPVFLNGVDCGLCGDGDYSPKVELFQKLMNDSETKELFTWVNEDIYTYFQNHPEIKFDYYFDDAVHDDRYLIPLFEMIIPRCNPGAIIGTHDATDIPVKRFIDWLMKRPEVEEGFVGNNSFFVRIKA